VARPPQGSSNSSSTNWIWQSKEATRASVSSLCATLAPILPGGCQLYYASLSCCCRTWILKLTTLLLWFLLWCTSIWFSSWVPIVSENYSKI
jgi:hypothetical protein